jgi:tRNA (guanine37-N1)-methyltransferase
MIMKCVIVTLFPEAVSGYFDCSILKRARAKLLLDVRFCALRDFATGKHRVTDDLPYGGGPGMVLKPEPIYAALEAIQKEAPEGIRVILPSPQGAVFNQEMAGHFAREPRTLVFVCGRYEGIDARVGEGFPSEEVSIGDYVVTGGELPAMVMIDAAARLIPGALGDEQSLEEESFSTGRLDYPHYTRPAEFRGMRVPEVLLSGNHEAIRRWREEAALLSTGRKRPDLLK